MANREALRELQARLASRLQTAKAQGLSLSWLAVRAGGGHYLLPLAQAGEIFSLTDLQPVPYALPWFAGVVNLRGSLYGVVDLAAFVGADRGATRAESVPGEASVVTFNTALEVNSALLVDALAGLRHVESFSASEPAAAEAPVFFGHRYTDANGVTWQEINLQLLSQWPEFLSISA